MATVGGSPSLPPQQQRRLATEPPCDANPAGHLGEPAGRRRTMQRKWRVGATATVAAALMLTGLAGQAHAQTEQSVIASVDLNGVVDPIIADHIVSVIHRAYKVQAEAVLLRRLIS